MGNKRLREDAVLLDMPPAKQRLAASKLRLRKAQLKSQAPVPKPVNGVRLPVPGPVRRRNSAESGEQLPVFAVAPSPQMLSAAPSPPMIPWPKPDEDDSGVRRLPPAGLAELPPDLHADVWGSVYAESFADSDPAQSVISGLQGGTPGIPRSPLAVVQLPLNDATLQVLSLHTPQTFLLLRGYPSPLSSRLPPPDGHAVFLAWGAGVSNTVSEGPMEGVGWRVLDQLDNVPP